MFSEADNRAMIATLGGTTVSVTAYGLPVTSFSAIFDAEVEVLDQFNPGLAITRPQLTMVDADAALLTREQVLTINGKGYRLYGDPRRSDGVTVYLLIEV